MPYYSFVCDNEACDIKEVEEFMDIKNYNVPDCPLCKKRMRRIYTPTVFTVDFRPGFDVGLGEYCDTKKQRDTIVADNNLRRRLS